MLLILLRQRGRLLWNRITRGQNRGRKIAGAVAAMVLTFGFVSVAGLNAGLLVERIAQIDAQVGVQMLPLLLSGVVVLTLVTSLASAFHHLFMAGDLELLLVAPVPARSLFALKIFEIWRDSLHIIIFQGAALYGFGQSFRLSALYYVLAVAIGLLLTLSSSAAAAILALAMARVRFGEAILGATRLLALVLLLPVGVLGASVGFGRARASLLLSQGSVNALVGELRGIGEPPKWSPTTWASHVLLGDEDALLSAALLLATAVVLFVALQFVFDALFRSAWERVRFPGARRSTGRLRVGARLPIRAPVGPLLGILLKDVRIIVRDPRWRTGTVFSVVALAVPAALLFAGDPFARSSHAIRFWLSMLPVPYFAYLFGSQQGAATLIYEGRNLALLRAAPVSMARILLAKVGVGFGIVLLVTWLATLAVGLSHGGEPLEMAEALVIASWLAFGATLAAVSGAALTIDFEGDNPQRRVGCIGTVLISTLSLFFFLANSALVAWWIFRTALAVPRQLLRVVPLLDWGLIALAAMSVLAILVASRSGARRLATWEMS